MKQWVGLTTILVVILSLSIYYSKSRLNSPSVPCRKSGSLELKVDKVVNISIVFGYKDTRPSRLVADRYERNAFVDEILRLHFLRSPDDDDLFHSQLKDTSGVSHALNLRIIASSVGPDDNENRTNPMQILQSSYAMTKFSDALKNDDVVFYIGHSRRGGGPDFSPPLILRNGHVNYSWYRKNAPGLELLLSGLKSSNSIQELGMFSCDSNPLFFDKIRAISPQIKVIGTNSLVYYSVALSDALGELNKILGEACDP